MFFVLLRSLTFIFIIVLAFCFKRKNILKREDANILSTIIMNITLPCALFSSASSISISSLMILLLFIGVFANVITMGIGYLSNLKENGKIQGLYVLNVSSYNIGNFALPFAQTFFVGQGLAYLCAFDIGNAIMGLGTTYAIADHLARGEGHFSIKELLKKLTSSLPFDVYFVIFVCTLLHITIPESFLSMTSIIGSANTFLVMFMIGLMMEIEIPKNDRTHIIRIITMRIVSAIVMSLAIYYLLPIPSLAKQVLTLALFAPIANASTVFTQKMGYGETISATASSLNIIISIIIMTGLLMIYA